MILKSVSLTKMNYQLSSLFEPDLARRETVRNLLRANARIASRAMAEDLAAANGSENLGLKMRNPESLSLRLSFRPAIRTLKERDFILMRRG